MKVLIQAGGNVNQAQTTTGCPPLWQASQNGNVDLVKVLINAGGNVNQAAWTLRGSLEGVGYPSKSVTGFNAYVSISQMVDLDLDGMKDFVYFTRLHDKMKILHRIKLSGPNHFVSRTQWALDKTDFGKSPQGLDPEISPVAVDLNGDGKQDLVVGSQGLGLFYYQSKGLHQNGIVYQEKISLLDQDGTAIDDGKCSVYFWIIFGSCW